MRREERNGGKLDPRWDGPYCISGCVRKGVHRLSRDGVCLKKTVNSARLKLYHSSEDCLLSTGKHITEDSKETERVRCFKIHKAV